MPSPPSPSSPKKPATPPPRRFKKPNHASHSRRSIGQRLTILASALVVLTIAVVGALSWWAYFGPGPVLGTSANPSTNPSANPNLGSDQQRVVSLVSIGAL